MSNTNTPTVNTPDSDTHETTLTREVNRAFVTSACIENMRIAIAITKENINEQTTALKRLQANLERLTHNSNATEINKLNHDLNRENVYLRERSNLLQTVNGNLYRRVQMLEENVTGYE